MASSARATPMLQLSVKDPTLPLEIRRDFIKKVYGILFSMLVVSFAIVAPFVVSRRDTMRFMEDHMWILWLTSLFLLVQQLVNIAMSFEACCGGGPCMRGYLTMFVTVPWNYLYCFSYAACFGVVLGFICSTYDAESVGLVFVLTATIMAALTVYAVFTKTDFTGFGMYLFAAMVGLLLLGIVALFVPGGSVLHRTIAGLGAILFSFVIIYDTQLIFGTASLELGRSAARKVEFTLDMYCFAAYQLYLDFVNLFLYLLEIFGRRRDGA